MLRGGAGAAKADLQGHRLRLRQGDAQEARLRAAQAQVPGKGGEEEVPAQNFNRRVACTFL